MGSIYRLYCKESGKSYIGQHNKEDPYKRIREHFNEADCERNNAVLYKAIRKYGRDSFEASCLCVCKTQEELDFMEDYYITQFKSMLDENGYNMKRGGMKRCIGYKHTEEVKQQISEMRKGSIISEEQREKLSEALKGKSKNWSEEALETMSERNKINASKYKPTEEIRKQVSEKLTGIKKNYEPIKSNIIKADIEKIKDFIKEVESNLEDSGAYSLPKARRFDIEDVIFLRLFPKVYGLRELEKIYNCVNSTISAIIKCQSYKDIIIPLKYYEEAIKYDYLFVKEKEEPKTTTVEVPKEKMEQWVQPIYEPKHVEVKSKKELISSENYDISKDIKQVQHIIDKIKIDIKDDLIEFERDIKRKLNIDDIIFIRLFPTKFKINEYARLFECSSAAISKILKMQTFNYIVIPEEYYKIASEFRFK